MKVYCDFKENDFRSDVRVTLTEDDRIRIQVATNRAGSREPEFIKYEPVGNPKGTLKQRFRYAAWSLGHALDSLLAGNSLVIRLKKRHDGKTFVEPYAKALKRLKILKRMGYRVPAIAGWNLKWEAGRFKELSDPETQEFLAGIADARLRDPRLDERKWKTRGMWESSYNPSMKE